MRRTAVSESAGALVDGREEARRARGLPHLAGAFPTASVCFAAGGRFQMASRWTLVGVLAAGVLTVALLVPLGAAAQDGTPTGGGIAATIVGTPGNDTIQGTSGDDVIGGRGVNDTMDGAPTDGESPDGGDEFLAGGAKNDTLDGDTGVDKCVNGEVVVNCEVYLRFASL